MTDYLIRPAELADAQVVVDNINPADRDELLAMGFFHVQSALERGIMVSRDPKAGCANGEVKCLFGVVPPTALSWIATPWLIGTVDLKQHGTRFLRESRVYFDEWKQAYEELANYVDVRHTAAIRWLKWLGFQMDEPKPFGPQQLPFMRFYTTRGSDVRRS